jgi:hypothetical protein
MEKVSALLARFLSLELGILSKVLYLIDLSYSLCERYVHALLLPELALVSFRCWLTCRLVSALSLFLINSPNCTITGHKLSWVKESTWVGSVVIQDRSLVGIAFKFAISAAGGSFRYSFFPSIFCSYCLILEFRWEEGIFRNLPLRKAEQIQYSTTFNKPESTTILRDVLTFCLLSFICFCSPFFVRYT